MVNGGFSLHTDHRVSQPEGWNWDFVQLSINFTCQCQPRPGSPRPMCCELGVRDNVLSSTKSGPAQMARTHSGKAVKSISIPRFFNLIT